MIQDIKGMAHHCTCGVHVQCTCTPCSHNSHSHLNMVSISVEKPTPTTPAQRQSLTRKARGIRCLWLLDMELVFSAPYPHLNKESPMLTGCQRREGSKAQGS